MNQCNAVAIHKNIILPNVTYSIKAVKCSKHHSPCINTKTEISTPLAYDLANTLPRNYECSAKKRYSHTGDNKITTTSHSRRTEHRNVREINDTVHRIWIPYQHDNSILNICILNDNISFLRWSEQKPCERSWALHNGTENTPNTTLWRNDERTKELNVQKKSMACSLTGNWNEKRRKIQSEKYLGNHFLGVKSFQGQSKLQGKNEEGH